MMDLIHKPLYSQITQIQPMFIALHIGAGTYSGGNNKIFCNLMNHACRSAMKLLKDGGSSIEAVSLAISILEDNEYTNSGRGSNLNLEGRVECDASIMDGSTGVWTGCGSVPGVRNPINLAKCLNDNFKTGILSHDRIPPMYFDLINVECWLDLVPSLMHA